MSTDRRVFLTLGSNIEPRRNLLAAVREIDIAIGVDGVSRTYEAVPVGAPGTPTFLNAAVVVRTALRPSDLKHGTLRPIEARLGRRRTSDPNAPRTIDIDIALVEGVVVSDPEAGLEIPDPETVTLPHLAFPLRDLDPDVENAAAGKTLAEVADALGEPEGIRVRSDIDLERALSSPAGGVEA